jgi:hypothetical protein
LAIAESFRRLGEIGLGEAAVRVRQMDAKEMQPDLLARDITIRLARIRPRATGAIPQWHARLGARHGQPTYSRNRGAAGKFLFGVVLAFRDMTSSRAAKCRILNLEFRASAAQQGRKAMHHAGPLNSAFGAESFGLKYPKSISYNFEAPRLVEDAIRRGEAMVAKGGA